MILKNVFVCQILLSIRSTKSAPLGLRGGVGRDGGTAAWGGRLSWHLFHDVHSSPIVAAAIGASASGCTLGAATY